MINTIMPARKVFAGDSDTFKIQYTIGDKVRPLDTSSNVELIIEKPQMLPIVVKASIIDKAQSTFMVETSPEINRDIGEYKYKVRLNTLEGMKETSYGVYSVR